MKAGVTAARLEGGVERSQDKDLQIHCSFVVGFTKNLAVLFLQEHKRFPNLNKKPYSFAAAGGQGL